MALAQKKYEALIYISYIFALERKSFQLIQQDKRPDTYIETAA